MVLKPTLNICKNCRSDFRVCQFLRKMIRQRDFCHLEFFRKHVHGQNICIIDHAVGSPVIGCYSVGAYRPYFSHHSAGLFPQFPLCGIVNALPPCLC